MAVTATTVAAATTMLPAVAAVFLTLVLCFYIFLCAKRYRGSSCNAMQATASSSVVCPKERSELTRKEKIVELAAIVYFAYGGFDNIATMAEETKNPSRDIPLGLLGSMSVITAIYCIMVLVLSMMQPYTAIDRSAAYSVAFASVGMSWAQYMVALVALKGMTTVLLVFALVHPRTGTPVHATALIAVCSAYIALFSRLDVLSSLLSVSTLFIFMMMATALLVRRYYVWGVTTRTHALRFTALLLLLIIALSIDIAAYWGELALPNF
ncbi:cationic amino acid transporter 5-like [Miscanthus floridulus]|uniref:cationic amino acid transporter 5-like n=1 Tax=Miscanthus floridulus TaxID=154761 RepID=UPI0034584BAE